ncbi:MAG: DMT family transporter [Cyanobacteria bacterium J06638_6]
MVILGSLCLATQNVLVRVIFSESTILGQFTWGGLISPSPANSLLILQMRSLLILPVMTLLSYHLYPATGQILKALVQPPMRAVRWLALASSVFLFIALTLLFIALASIPAGVATVLFFIHPVITGLLSWWVFGHRPSRLRVGVTAGVLMGSVLVVPSFVGLGSSQVGLGVGAALGASVAYSIQGVLAQICFRQIDPVPFTLINFGVIVLLSSLGLLLVQIDVPPDQWRWLWLLSLFTAGLTLLGQLLYNIGIHLVRAASMAIVAVSNPVFTTAIAWLVLQESLQGRQFIGMVLVVMSIIALGQDQNRTASSP